MTPSARSTKWLRDRGWIVCRVEQRLHMPKAPFPVTRDAFGFGDLLAAKQSPNEYFDTVAVIALVQVTSGSNHDAHKDKILAEPNAQKWKDAGGVILLHSWAKRGPRGARKKWQLREEVL